MVQLVKRMEPWLHWLRLIQMLQRFRGDPVVVREITYPPYAAPTFYKDNKGGYYIHAQSGGHEHVYVIGASMTEVDEFTNVTFIVGDSPLCPHYALQLPIFAHVPPRQNFGLRVEAKLEAGSVYFHGWSVSEDELKTMRKDGDQ